MVLVTAPLRIGQYIGQYLASRLIKSGIEYVILAGSSVFLLPGLNPDIGRDRCLPGARSARFFEGFWHFGTRNPKILLGCGGTPLRVGSCISKYWNIYGGLMASLSIGKIYSIF